MSQATYNPEWEQIHQSRHWGTAPYDIVIKFAQQHFGEAASKSSINILDLGTAAGAEALALAEMGFSVDAVDASETAVLRCLRRKTRKHERVNVTIGDITYLPYSDDRFDAVIDWATIQHLGWESARESIREIIRVLKPGGRLLSAAALESPSPTYIRLLGENKIPLLYEGLSPLFDLSEHRTSKGEKVAWWIITGTKPC